MGGNIIITKINGQKELFDEHKLFHSLRNAGGGDEVANAIVEQIGGEIYNNITTSDIYRHAFNLLRRHSMPMAIKYSLRRAIGELGPDGFPFEKFVARIFNAWGYETITDQIIVGECVEHEIDIVAWRGNDLAMIEAKFHNEFGMKSDLKVVLYVKARYDDLSKKIFNFGHKERRLTEKYIFTNTKFTDKAIQYSKCQNLKLIGWNYPLKGNLHDIITEYKLEPITSLSLITDQNKKDLINKGILICADLIDDPYILETFGINREQTNKIISEARNIVANSK